MYVSIYAAALGQVPDSTLDAKYKEDFKSSLAHALAHPTDTQHRSIMQVSNTRRNMCSLSLSLSLGRSLSLQCMCSICPKMHTHVRGAAGSANTLSRRKGRIERPRGGVILLTIGDTTSVFAEIHTLHITGVYVLPDF